MKQINDIVYKRLSIVSQEVSKKLRKKGIVVPVRNKDGSVSIGKYLIVKSKDQYTIIDNNNEIVVDKLNLPQTAILLANSLALGKLMDQDILFKDRYYGYAAFEEALYKNYIKRQRRIDRDKAELIHTKSEIHKFKQVRYKTDIVNSFEKLKAFV